jgi:hypothetical protein
VDIKLDWRDNKHLVGEKQKRAVEHAINGIKQMNQYTQLDNTTADWKLQL